MNQLDKTVEQARVVQKSLISFAGTMNNRSSVMNRFFPPTPPAQLAIEIAELIVISRSNFLRNPQGVDLTTTYAEQTHPD